MSCRIILSAEFKRKAKRLGKKQRSLGADLQVLFDELLEEPRMGVQIGPDTY